jgi:hypothetical protein
VTLTLDIHQEPTVTEKKRRMKVARRVAAVTVIHLKVAEHIETNITHTETTEQSEIPIQAALATNLHAETLAAAVVNNRTLIFETASL